MSIILVSLAFLSCWDYSLPNRIELEVEGSVDLPVRITASDWGSLLTETLKRAFSGTMENVIGVEVYNVNYGQEVQAFCVYFPIKISDSLNPKDYLDGINLTQMDGSSLKIDESVEVPSFGDFTIECPVNFPLLTLLPSGTSTVNYPEGIPFSISKEFQLESFVSNAFLHAVIEKGSFDINLDLSGGDVILAEDEFTKTYDIVINQEPDTNSLGSSLTSPYRGLSYINSSSDLQPLNNQDINKKSIKINGTVTLRSKTGDFTVTKKPEGNDILAGNLKIKMNISEYEVLDLDFNKVSVKPDDPEPVSLADAANYLNWIKFPLSADDGNGKTEPGIGININFEGSSIEIIEGLAMSIECDALEFNSAVKSLNPGNNVFGNTEPVKLNLAENKTLQFKFKLLPSGDNKDVLHLTYLTMGEPLKIQGEAKLFQHWVEAEVNISDSFEEQFPDKDEKPINLSLLDDYFKGFKFNNVEAAAYFSGPDNIFKKIKPSLRIDVQYSTNETTVMKEDSITFEKKQIVIAGNSDYLDAKGAYKKKELPLNGKNHIDFVTVLNSLPNDLVFHYFIDVSGTDIITPDLFVDNNEAVSHDIFVTIMLLIHLDLTAGDGGGRIMFPDMFNKDQKDLLGRKNLDENSKFTSLNVDYINFTVDFTSQFFTGGKLFIEKDKPILFPNGIPLNGSKISLNIRNKELDLIRNKLIPPDFRLEFEPGEKIIIPKNIGVTSVKIEAKSKNTINFDF
jgi:hypothetical protein